VLRAMAAPVLIASAGWRCCIATRSRRLAGPAY